MPDTDRQTDKSTRWAMTVYEEQWSLLEKMPEIIAEWGWQEERCPETGRIHRQGYFRTHRQVRFSQIKAVLPGIHVEVARNWAALLEYCKKTETAIGNTIVHEVSTNKPMTMAESLIALAKYHWSNGELQMNRNTLLTNSDKRMSYEELFKVEYWHCVNSFLRETNKDNAIGLFTNNQMVLAWVRTRDHWISRHKKMLATNIDPNASQVQTSVTQAFDEEGQSYGNTPTQVEGQEEHGYVLSQD